MGTTNFAEACRRERDLMLATYADASGESAVGQLLSEADLSPDQRTRVVAALDTALSDAFYTLLLALDGSTSLGDSQQSFVLTDSDGNIIANGDGRLEAAAWEALQSSR